MTNDNKLSDVKNMALMIVDPSDLVSMLNDCRLRPSHGLKDMQPISIGLIGGIIIMCIKSNDLQDFLTDKEIRGEEIGLTASQVVVDGCPVGRLPVIRGTFERQIVEEK